MIYHRIERLSPAVKTLAVAGLFLLLLSDAGWSQAPLELSVEEAVERALESDHSLSAGRQRKAAADSALAAARSSRLPELSLTGRYARIEEQEPLQVDTPSGTLEIGESFSDATSVELALMQPLFLGGRLSSRVEQSDSLSEAATLEQLWRRTSVKLELYRAYWRLVEARLRQDAFAERRDQVAANLETIRRRFQEGLVTQNEVLSVEMGLAQAELELVEAENALALASADLAVRIGEDPGRLILPSSDLPSRSDTIPDLEVLVERGLAQRPDLAALRRQLNARARGVEIARSGLYPELFVTGQYRYARPNEALFPPPDSFEDSWQIGVMGRINLGSMPATIHQTREAEANRQATYHSVAAAEERLRLEVRRAYLSWGSSRQRVHLGRTMVRQAEENLANTAVRVDNGTALNEDLLDAQVDLLEARLALTAAVVERELAWLEVMYTSATES
jgi:outer membrane protein TolC